MIDFNQELKKFKPAEGMGTGETEIFRNDIKDITDLVEEILAAQGVVKE